MTLNSDETLELKRLQTKKKKQLVAVGVLSVVLVVVLVRSGDSKPRTIESPKLNVTPTSTAAVSPAAQADSPIDAARFSHPEQLTRLDSDALYAVDLFREADVPEPSTTETPSIAEPNVSYAIGAVYGSFDSTEKSALVDGDIVRSGDVLKGKDQVLSVSAEGVTLSK
ncbi:MAG: hypothetical protein AAFX06_10900 [Planctomycetota bacterium]